LMRLNAISIGCINQRQQRKRQGGTSDPSNPYSPGPASGARYIRRARSGPWSSNGSFAIRPSWSGRRSPIRPISASGRRSMPTRAWPSPVPR
jgi:hypothetical protein